MPVYSLETVAKAKAYLDAHSIPYVDVEERSGGFANWVYHVSQSGGPGLILKHTNIIVRAFPTIQAPVDRSDSEARALSVIPALLPDLGDRIHLPVLLRYDAESHVQHQRPAGGRTLKDAYQDSSLDIPSVGARIGRWIASLHAVPPPANFEDNTTARRIYGGVYRHSPGTLERSFLDPAPAQLALDKYAPLLQTENENICHGDFWSGNVLLPVDGGSNPDITILDWEMSRRGYGATDIGQFAAEAWLLDKYRGGRGLLPAFLTAYRVAAGAKVTAYFAKRAAIHCGAHLAYWPSLVEWADFDETKKILAFGAELLRGAEQGGEEWLQGSVFAPLVKPT